jgi:hypothetical protein
VVTTCRKITLVVDTRTDKTRTPQEETRRETKPTPKESNLEVTREYLIDRGIAAKHLLQSDAFGIVMRELGASLEQELLTSEPHESKKRESAYFQHRGLQSIFGTLVAFVQLGEEAQAEVDNKDNAN